MSTERFKLLNKVALITGAGGLLGIEHAAALLECDATVVLTDISQASLDDARIKLESDFDSPDVHFYLMDVTDLESVLLVQEQLAGMDLVVDILINNAAIDPKVKGDLSVNDVSRLENFSREQWDLQIAVGLTGAFNCCKVFGSEMVKKGGGVILNIASDLSVFAPDQRLYQIDNLPDEQQPVKPVTYSVIKTGLIGLTRYLATYWASQNIRCNALSPGGVFNGQNDRFVEKLTDLIPLGRMANSNEYRAAVQFLCSDASSYMNGQNIVIDGGRSVL
jgi:NAD(P)-dependent dehydrogenase (short-subunit alcohol dehydrogenase family)